jgi:hypothetical protein
MVPKTQWLIHHKSHIHDTHCAGQANIFMDDKVSVMVREEENGGVKFGNINTSGYSSKEYLYPPQKPL